MKLLSTEAEGVNVAIPESDKQVFVNSAGRVGALLGLKSADAGMELQLRCKDCIHSCCPCQWHCLCTNATCILPIPHTQQCFVG